MTATTTQQMVIKAINERLVLKIRETGATFDIELEPYSVGNDFLQKQFVWGYIPYNGVFYKFYLDFADSISATDKHFTPQPNLNYYFFDEEEHFGSVDSIKFWQNFGYHGDK